MRDVLLGRSLGRALFLSSLMLAAFGCESSTLTPPPTPNPPPSDAGGVPDVNGFPDVGAGGLLVTRVAPDHGPFIGGNSAIVRGSGFTNEAFVTVGGRLVQPADTRLLDANRLAIVLPAGEPGPADVTVMVGDAEATLPDGYFYDDIYLEPSRGSTAGGTFVTLIGTGAPFTAGDTLTFGPTPCNELTLVSPTRMTCLTPPGPVSTVDVTLTRGEDGSTTTIEDGFEYYDSSDPFNGGLGGGPIDGTINVTVIDAFTGAPVDAAFVMLGDDIATEHKGMTGITGQISFSGPDVAAPATIHAAKWCYEKTSFHTFDAQDVTIFLVPWMDMRCGMGSGENPPGRPVRAPFVSGELIFLGPNEMGPNPWTIVPEPRDGWERIAYVYTTQRCAGDDFSCLNPDPGLGGGQPVVREGPPLGTLGYPYRILTRTGAIAVYALAGLQNTVTREFLPYVMGVARNVLAGPGEEVEHVDILMNIPLDHFLDVRLAGVPEPSTLGPDRFVVDADIDLGGEGIIVRRIANARMDVVRQRTLSSNFRFFAQPAILGEIEDGRYRVEASWVTGSSEFEPETHVIRQGIRDVDTEILVDGFLGLPVATSPGFGERIPADRVLRWEATEGGEVPDLHYVILQNGETGNPEWRAFVPGEQSFATIPNLASIPEINDIENGIIFWAVYAISIPGFDFDTVSYADLNDRLWDAWSFDIYQARR